MKAFETSGIKRIIVVHLGKGEKVLESIRKVIEEQGIRNGVVLSGIGSLRKITMHYIKTLDDLPVNEYITIESPSEMGSVQGLILNGEPHLHIVCSDLNRVYAGHMEDGCEVQYLAELTIAELDCDLVRKLDEYGISYIDKKLPFK
ncbi:MAG TPA: DUF296 domain-containing protein [Lachnospiraceae bacterium]|jgi:hypothetical protein|nr:DUF296 domain-containing protein [Lachnospiraceae bacterium]HCM13544.1 DUF296 domain-containing protein [Lachnospiraceae bacterium]